MTAEQPERERLLDLLAARATEGLDERETGELQELLRKYSDVAEDDMDIAAAAADLALMGAMESELPADLRKRILSSADEHLSSSATVPVADSAVRTSKPAGRRADRGLAYLGWLAAAAALLFAFVQRPEPSIAPTPEVARADFLARSPADLLRADWKASAPGEYGSVSGDVLWSSAEQAGFMRLRGMPANDPQRTQYQLWIVDPSRDKEPVDGGVFDVPAGVTEVVIPIDAKLQVSSPTVFALTREQPGGVVVSEGPLIVVAAAN